MNEIPVACSLDARTQKSRAEDWRSLLVPNVVERSLITRGVRLVLRQASGVRAELDRLIALENSCCAWINWDVEESAVAISVDVTAQQDAGSRQLREWFCPPVRA